VNRRFEKFVFNFAFRLLVLFIPFTPPLNVWVGNFPNDKNVDFFLIGAVLIGNIVLPKVVPISKSALNAASFALRINMLRLFSPHEIGIDFAFNLENKIE
jgi:hypothetical protein